MESSHAFHTLLRDKIIGGISSTIPDDMGRFRNGIPTAEELIPIPTSEAFPLDEPEKNDPFSEEELYHLFAQAQLETIHSDPSKLANNSQIINGPILEIPGEFASIDDYIQFKRELATFYKKRSDNYEWPEPMGVCSDPLCLNSTAPTFKYCLYHLPKDEKFESLGLVSKCQAKVDDHDCTIPCGNGCSKCAFHRSIPRDSNK